MKKAILFIIPILMFACSGDQEYNTDIKPISSYFPKERAKVLVVGSFHFNYPKGDIHQTEDSKKIDVLKEPKKSEVTELVEYIKKFKPNKIAIEASDKWGAVDKLRAYNAGNHRDERSERFQVGIRLASELNLDTLYSVNEWSMLGDIEKLDSAYLADLYVDYDFVSDDPYFQAMVDWTNDGDILKNEISILDYFKYSNSREYHEYDYGLYLVGDFKLDSLRGADILSIYWYNRNLRIFRRIQEITEGPDDRILVLFGNGHASVLRQLFECSPEYDYIEFNSLSRR